MDNVKFRELIRECQTLLNSLSEKLQVAQSEMYLMIARVESEKRITHRDVLRGIAAQNQGIVRVKAAADILLTSGQSKSKYRNLIISVYKLLSNSDEWEWVAPGTFKLRNREENEKKM